MNYTSTTTRSEAELSTPTAERTTRPRDYLWRFIVVAFGMIVGSVIALIIGLAANWVPINC